MNSWPTTQAELSAVYEDFKSRYGKAHAVAEMARAYGFSARTVYTRLAEAGVRKSRPPVQQPSADDLRELYPALIAEHGERWAIGEIAKRYGVVYMSARKWLIDAGLHTITPQTPRRPITEPCRCGAKAVTRYKDQDPPLCFRCYMRTYAADPDSKFRRAARRYIAEVKRMSVCVDCVAEGRDGKWPAAVLHFDHVPERGPKLFNIGNGDYAIKSVQAEIAKCDVVCANHHAIRTWITRGKPLDQAV